MDPEASPEKETKLRSSILLSEGGEKDKMDFEEEIQSGGGRQSS